MRNTVAAESSGDEEPGGAAAPAADPQAASHEPSPANAAAAATSADETAPVIQAPDTQVPDPAAIDLARRRARLRAQINARAQARAEALVAAAGVPARAPEPGALPVARANPDMPAAFQQPSVFDDVAEKPAARRRRRLWLAVSALIGIVLPSLLAIVYYGLIASDQFVTEVRFLVKAGGPVTPDLLGQLTGSGSISTFLDAQTVSDYLRSRQIIDDLSPSIDLHQIFRRPGADFVARLPADASMEDLTEYWQSMVEVSTEMISGIVGVTVRTFSREDSARLGQAILEASERLVNKLSARARDDAVRFATQDLQTAEERLRSWRGKVYQLREKEETLDAGATAEAHTVLIGQLEAELAKTRSELQYRQSLMNDSAPLLTSLRSKIASISAEIERVRKQATSGGRAPATASSPVSSPGSSPGAAGPASSDGRSPLTRVLSGFEEAQAELAISEEYYKSALRYLEEARAQADRQQVYVATIVAPHEAQESRYPLRIQFIVFAVVVSGIVWGLVMLIAFSIRDHVM